MVVTKPPVSDRAYPSHVTSKQTQRRRSGAWAVGAERAWRRGMPVTDIRMLVRDLGGPKKVGQALGVSHSTVCSWQRRGSFPAPQAARLLLVYPHIDQQRVISLTARTKTPPDDE